MTESDPTGNDWRRSAARLNIEVHFAAIDIESSRSPSGYERAAKEWIWTHAARNSAIARIATAVIERNAVELRSQQLFSAGLPGAFGAVEWIAILVESVVHAEALVRLLPTFGVQALVQPHGIGTRLQFPVCTLTTLVAAAESGCFSPSIAVNAMGGPWMPRFERLPPAGCGNRLVVIDLDDAYSDTAIRHTRQRIQQYVRMGYHVTDHRRNLVADDSPIVLVPY